MQTTQQQLDAKAEDAHRRLLANMGVPLPEYRLYYKAWLEAKRAADAYAARVREGGAK